MQGRCFEHSKLRLLPVITHLLLLHPCWFVAEGRAGAYWKHFTWCWRLWMFMHQNVAFPLRSYTESLNGIPKLHTAGRCQHHRGQNRGWHCIQLVSSLHLSTAPWALWQQVKDYIKGMVITWLLHHDFLWWVGEIKTNKRHWMPS